MLISPGTINTAIKIRTALTDDIWNQNQKLKSVFESNISSGSLKLHIQIQKFKNLRKKHESIFQNSFKKK